MPGAEFAATPGVAARRARSAGTLGPRSALLPFSSDVRLKSALIGFLLLVTCLVCRWQSLQVPAAHIGAPVALVTALLALAHYYRRRGEASFVLCLSALSEIVAFATCYVVAMYALATPAQPLVDGQLASFDAWCGVLVPRFCRFAADHPTIAVVLR